jgi:hypothetical protein
MKNQKKTVTVKDYLSPQPTTTSEFIFDGEFGMDRVI